MNSDKSAPVGHRGHVPLNSDVSRQMILPSSIDHFVGARSAGNQGSGPTSAARSTLAPGGTLNYVLRKL